MSLDHKKSQSSKKTDQIKIGKILKKIEADIDKQNDGSTRQNRIAKKIDEENTIAGLSEIVQKAENYFDETLKHFFANGIKKENTIENLNHSLDLFFESHYFNKSFRKIYSDIDDDVYDVKKINETIYKDEEKRRELVKYIIKAKTKIGRKFQEQVIDKIKNYIYQSVDGKTLKLKNQDNKVHILDVAQLNLDLVKLENMFLDRLTDKYIEFVDNLHILM